MNKTTMFDNAWTRDENKQRTAFRRKVGYNARELYGAAENLRDRMQRLMDRLEAANAEEDLLKSNALTGINSLGEVQSAGPEVDRLCALLKKAIELSAWIPKE